MQLVRGRLYSDEEARLNAPVAVLDERVAATLWPNEDPIGRLVVTNQGAALVPRTVVGVVRSINFRDEFRDESARGRAFAPPDPRGRVGELFVWRGTQAAAVRDAIVQAATELEPSAQVAMEALRPFERWMGGPRFLARLLGVLAGVALLLTVAGVYATTTYRVASRTAEIGIRMAMGATPSAVRRMVLLETLWPAAVWLGIGSVVCWIWVRTLESVLFGLQPHEPRVFALAGITVLGVAAVAAAVPAWLASRLDPSVALRVE